MTKTKNVALVLSGGGARGFAHIGAIEELERRGYRITSVAGTSIGSMVGGIFATGHLKEAKEWLLQLDWREIISLIDVTLSTSYMVKGERIINALVDIVPDCRIEQLPMPFVAIATDLRRNQEIVFDRGSLYAAIRASISIPSVFSPLRTKRFLLVDGGMVNPLPLNRVARSEEGDLLVSMNVSGREHHSPDEKPLSSIKENNYYHITHRSTMMMIEQLAALTLKLYPPDVAAEIPMNRFGVFDFDKVKVIIEAGREEMKRALDEYEAK